MRLDVALVGRGIARSRTHAATLIAEGRVTVNGEVATKPAMRVTDVDAIAADVERWVSRAAHKLLGALEGSGAQVAGRVLDAGASTGGFTQVCLERGASVVYAVDVGHGQLARQVAEDPRVRVREGLNLRDLTLADLDGEPVDLVVGDVSFISLRLILPQVLGALRPSGAAVLLVKPQFEVGRERLGAGGVVRDDGLRLATVDGVSRAAAELGWTERWRAESSLPGATGNVEYFLHLTR